MTGKELIEFEQEVATAFEAKQIHGPIHLSGGNEAELIEIFKKIYRRDWVFATYRNHYHALLHGIPRELVMREILAGHSMNLNFPDYHFMTSAIVGGILPIAVGVAAAIKGTGQGKLVWCFVGDMAGLSGAFHEAQQYAARNALPIKFVIEDNGMSCDSPTMKCWGNEVESAHIISYAYARTYPHVGIGKYVSF